MRVLPHFQKHVQRNDLNNVSSDLSNTIAFLPSNFVRSVERNTDPSLGRCHSFPITSESSIAFGCPRRLRHCTRRWAGLSICSHSADSVSPNAGSRSSFFLFLFSVRCCYSSFDPLAKYTENMPISIACEGNRYRRCIVADQRLWIIQDYPLASGSFRDIISRVMPSDSERFCTESCDWLIYSSDTLTWELKEIQKERDGSVVFRFFLWKFRVKVDDDRRRWTFPFPPKFSAHFCC